MTSIPNIEPIVSWSRTVLQGLLLWSCQALLLLGVAWVGLKLDRSRSATTRYRIWLIALAMVAAVPLLNSLSHSLYLPVSGMTPFPVPSSASRVALAEIPSVPPPAHSVPWLSLIWPVSLALWMAGVLTALFRLASSHRKLHVIRSHARLALIADLDCAHLMAAKSNLDQLRIGLSQDLCTPGLIGIIHPLVVLPADIAKWTSPEERMSILCHELAHIHRRDPLVGLLQSLVKALLFFHPMLRYACAQLNLERELACDDHVLRQGAEPRIYAESILKAVQRCLPATAITQETLFASKQTLERRIDMILDANRKRQPRRQWLFLLLPVTLLTATTWVVMPAARGQKQKGPSAPSALSVSARYQTDSFPVVDKDAIWTDTVKRYGLFWAVQGTGILVSGPDGRLRAEIKIPSSQAHDLQTGLPGNTRTGVNQRTINGKVIEVRPDTGEGMMVVILSLDTDLPDGAKAGVPVDARIELGILFSVLQVSRPVHGMDNSKTSVFRLDDDGQTATRVPVRFGKSSATTIEVIDGLKVGDRIILSDMSQFDGKDRIKLQ